MDAQVELQDEAVATDAEARRRRFVTATGALVLCCALWGYSFPTVQIATHAFDRHVIGEGSTTTAAQLGSRAVFNGVRFMLAAGLYWVVTRRRQRGFSRDDVRGGVVVGVFFAAGILLQAMGLRWALPSVSSFLTALAVVFAPLGQALVFRRAVGGATWVAVALAVAGMALLSWPNPGAAHDNTLAVVPPVPYLGEILTVAGSVLFTVQILALDRFGQRADPARLTLVMLVSGGALSLIAGPCIHPGVVRPVDPGGLVRDPTVWWTLVSLVVVSSVMAMHLMNTYQPFVSPATASVIYCTEPLFGTLFSLAFATERLTVLTTAGGLVVLASVLVVARAGQGGRRDEGMGG